MKTSRLLPTWRWYGPVDTVSLQDIRQAGAEGIVTAMHNLPHGSIWPLEEILERKALIAQAGLKWSVVESVPVHESIKTRTGDYAKYIDHYIRTLHHLAKAGIRTVCYNFMPVLDWTRTQLDFELPDLSRALRFEYAELAVFDLFILKRAHAEEDYDPEIRRKAEILFKKGDPAWINKLASNILMGVPGEASTTLPRLLYSIDTYKEIGHAGLRENLAFFLESIMPTCDELGIHMTLHPDDPPFDILGLPRIASNKEDLEFIVQQVQSPHNGICFCSGSLGAGKNNQLVEIMKSVGERIHFVHLRNVAKQPDGSFNETPHLAGDVDMYQLMKTLLGIQQSRTEPIPFRPDHGLQMLDDLKKETFPGYSAIGRLKGLAELRGLALGIERSV